MKYHHPRYLFRKFIITRIIEPKNSFLEIGPGDLDLAVSLHDKFDRGTVIDFNFSETQRIYSELPETLQNSLSLITADFMAYERIDEKFDCVISCEVMEHIENDEKFIDKIRNLMMDKGQLILSVPARKKYWGFDDELVGHYRRYEKKELRFILMNSGFSNIKIYSYGYPFTNIIRYFRIIFVKIHYQEKSKWSKQQRSQESAFLVNREKNYKYLAFVINKYTLFPLILVSSLFNKLDLGEGYIVEAKKEQTPI